MKKDLNYYKELLRMDEKIFKEQEDGYWQVSYRKLPNIIGKGFGVSAAERDLQTKAEEWIQQAIETGIEPVKKKRGTASPAPVRPCPFCGGKDIKVDITGSEGYVGCRDCDYELWVGEVDFDRRMPVENQAKKLWNEMRPIETALQAKLAELKARVAELEGDSNGK
jgi:predicted RNase H-like HicB family nuclease